MKLYTTQQITEIRAQLLETPGAATCPVHGNPLEITETLSWARRGPTTVEYKQEGWPSDPACDVWRASVLCDACGVVQPIQLDTPTDVKGPDFDG